jgi:hypothetical protein
LSKARYVTGQNTKATGKGQFVDGSWRGPEADQFKQKQMIAAGGSSRTDWAAKYVRYRM